MRSFHRHSVWIDVFGVLLLGALLLSGPAYLLYHLGGAATGGSGGGGGGGTYSAARASGPPALGPDRAASPRRGRRPLLSGRSGPSPSGVEAPFSASWRKEATPDLLGPSFSSRGGAGGGTGGAAFTRSGPEIASARPSGGRGTGQLQGRGFRGQAAANWRSEARKLAGRVRALSSQLGHLSRESSGGGTTEQGSQEVTAKGARSSASASSGPSLPSDPEKVPIGGLGWLAAAGAVYAVRCLQQAGMGAPVGG